MRVFDLSKWRGHGLDLLGCPLIGTIPDGLGIEPGVLEILGTHYAVRMADPTENAIGVQKIKLDGDGSEKTLGLHAVCPYCGYQDDNSWELPDSDGELECGQCYAVMEMVRDVTVTYSTYPAKPPLVISTAWI